MRAHLVITALLPVVVMFRGDVTSFSLELHQLQYVVRQQRLSYSLSNTQRRWTQPSLLLAAAAGNTGGDQPQQIISPFDTSAGTSDYGETGNVATTTTTTNNYEILDLTYENVELVLDSMRHYLIQDGGNVIIDEIDGPIVKLQLQGNCGTCPSSTQTMKMGYVHYNNMRFLFPL
jgi:hypothetical protein